VPCVPPYLGWVSAQGSLRVAHTSIVDDDPPICPACGVTMVPTALSAGRASDGEWVCLECEEMGELQE